MALDMTGLRGTNAAAYTDYIAEQSRNALAEKVQNTAQSTSAESTDEELMSACKQFEAYFMEQIFKSMEASVEALKGDSKDQAGTTLVNYFKGTTLQDVCATAVDRQSNGLAQMLYENMSRNYGVGRSVADRTDTELTDMVMSDAETESAINAEPARQDA